VQAAYVGNFEPAHSTENHVARALANQGVNVVRLQEQRFGWDPKQVPAKTAFVLWTHTHSLAPQRTHRRQSHFLEAMRRRGIPTISYHLDRYWDLYREGQIHGSGQEPFFTTDIMCSADGGNAQRWQDAGIDHVWMLPGVSKAECAPGTVRPEMVSDIAFCGSWQGVTIDESSGTCGGYHPESSHRHRLVKWLSDTYGDRCAFWPKRDQPAVRNEDLRDLYASAKVLVGDSCFAGDPRGQHYCSDRVPETIGRGGFLLHPYTEGVTDGTAYTPGEHLGAWQAGDWDGLRELIEHYLTHEQERREIAQKGRAHVLANHTYEVRMGQLIEMLRERGLIE
jgi:Uncharacterized protein conserved in bacteria